MALGFPPDVGAASLPTARVPFGDGTTTYLNAATLQFVTGSNSLRVNNPTVGANDAGELIVAGTARVLTSFQSYGGATVGNARGTNSFDGQFFRSTAAQVASGLESVLIGGRNNTASSSRGVVVGGTGNTASGGDRGSIVGGNANTVTGQDSFVGGGDGNTLAGGYNAAFGRVNTSTAVQYAYMFGEDNDVTAKYGVVFGVQAIADHFGEISHCTGVFAAVGDAQVSDVIWRRSTANATITELFLDGTGTRFTLADDSAYGFYIQVVARRTDANDECAVYEFRGGIDRNAGVTALISAVTKTVLAEDTAAWECDVTADDANDALIISVTGEAAKTIRWVASGRITRVVG